MHNSWDFLFATDVGEPSSPNQSRRGSPSSNWPYTRYNSPSIWSQGSTTHATARQHKSPSPLAGIPTFRPMPSRSATTSTYFGSPSSQNEAHLKSMSTSYDFDQFLMGDITVGPAPQTPSQLVPNATFLQRSLLLASTSPPVFLSVPPFSQRLPINPKVPFYELSKEVHERICDLLEPRHIVKWSSISRSSWIYTTRMKSVWMKALEKMCQRNALPPSSFSLLKDKSGSQLAWLATMPDRFHYWMKRQPAEAFVHKRRAFDIRNTSNPQPSASSRHPGLAMLLVPGGRYLIVDDGRYMTISDLGVGSQSEPRWVSTIKHEQPRRPRQIKSMLDAYPAPNGVDLRVIVFFDRLRDRLGTFHVYNVTPRVEGGDSAVRLLAAHTENDKHALYTFREDILITLAGSTLFIRNFVTKLEVSMKIHNDPPAKALMCSKMGHIILVHMHGFSVWRIPNFLDTSVNGEGLYSLPEGAIPPQFSLPVNFTEHMESDTGRKGSFTTPVFEKPSVWYEEFGSHPLVFDLARNRFGKDPCQFRWRYLLTIPDSGDTSGVPSIECISRFIVPNEWTNLHISGYSNDQILLTGMCDEGYGAVVCAPAVSPLQSPEVDTGCYSGLLFSKLREMFSGQFVFCPITGRVCYESKPYNVNVLDYFHL
ncbi:hypothetical protein CPB83DRAFT_885823 [Crepidotus variabilis]|uniref:F-box domain-containing protein n=1 Tax=Crepidotus variabilis TaxID=179855 RepID=A0A9P6E961_9AGAR|nr:hypothetical protein CPB83DRAFT_885823 [Crepidotus variabilis]